MRRCALPGTDLTGRVDHVAESLGQRVDLLVRERAEQLEIAQDRGSVRGPAVRPSSSAGSHRRSGSTWCSRATREDPSAAQGRVDARTHPGFVGSSAARSGEPVAHGVGREALAIVLREVHARSLTVDRRRLPRSARHGVRRSRSGSPAWRQRRSTLNQTHQRCGTAASVAVAEDHDVARRAAARFGTMIVDQSRVSTTVWRHRIGRTDPACRSRAESSRLRAPIVIER